MIAISVNDLTLRFGTTTILEKVSFSLEENDKLGIIGSNGSGKTSLFKLITGEYDAEEGEVFISKGKTVGILSQYGAFSDEDGGEGTTALDHMFAAFPTLLEWEKRLSELENLLNDHSDDEKHRIYTNEYMALNERFIRDGGLEFRGRCRSILTKLGFDDEAIAMAYERTCINTGTLKWPYMNSILKRWHDAGLHTADQVRAGDSKAQPKQERRDLSPDELEAIRRMMEEE